MKRELGQLVNGRTSAAHFTQRTDKEAYEDSIMKRSGGEALFESTGGRRDTGYRGVLQT